jgi:transketolase
MISSARALGRGQDPLLLDLRQVRHPRLRPDRDGDQLRRQPQDRRQPRGHHARRRRPQPDVLPDVAWFRSFTTMKDHRGNPGCYVLQPADAYAAYALTGVMAEYEGACYMRTLRADTEFLYSDDHRLQPRRLRGAQEGRDVVLCAAGYMVHEANKAIELLDKAGVSPRSSTSTRSPSTPRQAPRHHQRANGGYVITLEDNYGGGIGSAIADASPSRATASRSSRCTSAASPRAPRRPTRCSRCAA